jgi:hypothetical protein
MWKIPSLLIVVAVSVVAVRYSAGTDVEIGEDGVIACPMPSPARLVVHEWGTFTNFSGSDGVKLDFRPLIDNDLPYFVLDRAWQSGMSSFMKNMTQGRQRMETPVTYFYTDEIRDVNVRVRFPEGLLTEFYPPVKTMLPEFTLEQFGRLAPIGNSELDWGKVTLIPADQLRTHVGGDIADMVNAEVMSRLLPGVGTSQHYAHARETDSAIVHVHNPADIKRPRMPSGNFFEKFLFYRGIGNFKLPLHLECRGEGQFELTNNGKDEVRSLFLVTADGQELKYQTYSSVKVGETLQQASTASTIDSLCKDVATALEAEGLYSKEAWAMVNTWRASWFDEVGTRLFYVVPDRLTEELLPLTVEPQPDEVVRVLVGRMEIMTPEEEAGILQLVRSSMESRTAHATESAAARAAGKTPEPYGIPKELLNLGRLAEPSLV